MNLHAKLSCVGNIDSMCLRNLLTGDWQQVSTTKLFYNVQGLISEQQQQYMLICDTYGIQTRKRHVRTV